MDLNEEEHGSEDEDGAVKHDKQTHFKTELNKVNFTFTMPNCYDIPSGQDSNEEHLTANVQAIMDQDQFMGAHLDKIAQIVHSQEEFKNNKVSM